MQRGLVLVSPRGSGPKRRWVNDSGRRPRGLLGMPQVLRSPHRDASRPATHCNLITGRDNKTSHKVRPNQSNPIRSMASPVTCGTLENFQEWANTGSLCYGAINRKYNVMTGHGRSWEQKCQTSWCKNIKIRVSVYIFLYIYDNLYVWCHELTQWISC